jgi:hypothetical protein
MRSFLVALSCLIPAVLAVTFLLWFLSNLWKHSRKL